MASINGATIEIALVGREGLIGLPIMLGSETTPINALVQVPGEALRISAPAFRGADQALRGPGAAPASLYTVGCWFRLASPERAPVVVRPAGAALAGSWSIAIGRSATSMC